MPQPGDLDLGTEMGAADVGDARLTKRLLKIMSGLVEGPDKSFPKMFEDRALEGTYRFFNNEEARQSES